MGLDVYIGQRQIGSDVANIGPNDVVTHTFVYVTGSVGQITNTYGWGENAGGLSKGYWQQDTANDYKSAQILDLFNAGHWAGPDSLNAYIQGAYNILSTNAPHENGLIKNQCVDEAERLVSLAYTLAEIDRIDGMTSTFDRFGGYGRYDSEGNGYYIWDKGGAPGDIIGQTTNGDPIVAGGSNDPSNAGPNSAFFGYGVFDIQNSRGLQGAGRDFWLWHTFGRKH